MMMMCDENIKMKLDDDDDSATLPRLPIDQPLNNTASISLNAPFAANPTCSSTLGARSTRSPIILATTNGFPRSTPNTATRVEQTKTQQQIRKLHYYHR